MHSGDALSVRHYAERCFVCRTFIVGAQGTRGLAYFRREHGILFGLRSCIISDWWPRWSSFSDMVWKLRFCVLQIGANLSCVRGEMPSLYILTLNCCSSWDRHRVSGSLFCFSAFVNRAGFNLWVSGLTVFKKRIKYIYISTLCAGFADSAFTSQFRHWTSLGDVSRKYVRRIAFIQVCEGRFQAKVNSHVMRCRRYGLWEVLRLRVMI